MRFMACTPYTAGNGWYPMRSIIASKYSRTLCGKRSPLTTAADRSNGRTRISSRDSLPLIADGLSIKRPSFSSSGIGGLLIVYACYLLLRQPSRTLRTGPLSDACAGFLGGLTGGLAGFPGAFVTIWCGLKGWDKARQRGVYQPFILGMQPITLLVIHLMRPSSSTMTQLDWKTIIFIPAALLGAWFGWRRIFKRLSDRQFDIAVNALLVLSGIGLIL